MFDFGISHILLFGAIALVAIGPKQLPEVARTVGRFLNELKRASGDFGRQLMDPPPNNHYQNHVVQHDTPPLTGDPVAHAPLVQSEAVVEPTTEEQMQFNLVAKPADDKKEP